MAVFLFTGPILNSVSTIRQFPHAGHGLDLSAIRHPGILLSLVKIRLLRGIKSPERGNWAEVLLGSLYESAGADFSILRFRRDEPGAGALI
jgi:hypothetical protein